MNSRRSKRPDSGVTGCLVVDKPAGITSHDLVDIVRKELGTRKVGHAGTLDPDATGVMILGIGFGTKLLEYVVGADKTYEAEIQFGSETTTLDAAGEVTATYEMNLDLAEVKTQAEQLTGDIEQVPPMVSAIKIDGKRLHELAREGKTIERKARAVTVDRFDLEATDDQLVYSALIDCGSGTYVRSLAADLGKLLGGGAHLKSLRRTRVGAFQAADCCNVDDLSPEKVKPLQLMLGDIPRVSVDSDMESKVKNGQPIETPLADGYIAFEDSAGNLIAVYKAADGRIVPDKVVPLNTNSKP